MAIGPHLKTTLLRLTLISDKRARTVRITELTHRTPNSNIRTERSFPSNYTLCSNFDLWVPAVIRTPNSGVRLFTNTDGDTSEMITKVHDYMRGLYKTKR